MKCELEGGAVAAYECDEEACACYSSGQGQLLERLAYMRDHDPLWPGCMAHAEVLQSRQGG